MGEKMLPLGTSYALRLVSAWTIFAAMALFQDFLLWQDPLPVFLCCWVALKHWVPQLGVNVDLASSASIT